MLKIIGKNCYILIHCAQKQTQNLMEVVYGVSFCNKCLMEEIPSGYESLKYEKTYSQDFLALSHISYSEPEQNFNCTILKREEEYSTIHYVIMGSTLFDYAIGATKTTEGPFHFRCTVIFKLSIEFVSINSSTSSSLFEII